MKKTKEKLIDFDNSWVDKNLPYTSISTILAMLQEPFDQQAVAEKTFNKRFNDPESEYYQMTVEQILEAWSAKGAASLKYGSLLDDYIGIYFNGDDSDLELYKLDNNYDDDERLRNVTGSFDSFIKYVESVMPNLVFVDRERTLYYKIGDEYVKGRFDALFYDTEKKQFIIIDWKSSGSVDTEKTVWTKQLLGAAKHYPALNSYTYGIQVMFYKTALLAHYLPEGTDPDSITTRIVNLPGHLFEDGNNYKIYKNPITYNKEDLDNIFDFGIKKNKILSKKNNN